MKSIFESTVKSFDDERLDSFKYIKKEDKFQRLLASYIEGKTTAPLFIWQMPGNRTTSYIENFVTEKYGSVGLGLVSIGWNTTIDDLLSDATHIYDSDDLATEDDSEGVLLISIRTTTIEQKELAKSLIAMAVGTSDNLFVAPGWRVILVANAESGEDIWDPAFKKAFVNVEIDLETSSTDDEDDYDDEGLDESVRVEQDFTLSSPKEAAELIKSAIKKAIEDGDAGEETLVFFDEKGIIFGEPDEDDIHEYAPLYNLSEIVNFQKYLDYGVLTFDNIIIDEIASELTA